MSNSITKTFLNKRGFYAAFALLAALFAFALLADPAWAQMPTTLTVSKDETNTEPVQVGETIEYKIVVLNTGTADDQDAQSVVLNDILPTNTTFVSVATNQGSCTPLATGASSGTVTCNLGTIVAPGGGVTVTLRVKPTAEAGEVGSVSNTATAQGSNTNLATGSDTTDVEPSDITITKDDSPDPADVGEALLYTLRITNTGDTAQNIVLRDRLPDEVDFLAVDPEADCEESNNLVTCQFTIDNGDTQEVRILVQPQEEGTITNRAQVFLAGAENRFTPIAEARERTVVDDNGGPSPGPGPGPGPGPEPPPFDPDDPFEDIDDDGIIDAIDEDIDDLAEAEADLFSDETTDGELTDGQYDDEGGDSPVSATAEDGQAEASTPGAVASAGGDPDELEPLTSTPDDVVDEIPTSGPLPNTGGMPLLYWLLPLAGLLIMVGIPVYRWGKSRG